MPSTDADKFLASLSEAERERVKKGLSNAASFYTLEGVNVLNYGVAPTNLLAVIDGMERYVVDGNSPWKAAAAKKEISGKAFIIGDTVQSEHPNLKGTLFGTKTDISNNNLFIFGVAPPSIGSDLLLVRRMDEHYRSIFDESLLDLESARPETRTDAKFIERRQRQARNTAELKNDILRRIGIRDLGDIPKRQQESFCAAKKAELLEDVRATAAQCRRNYRLSCEVASLCCAALLMEWDEDDQGVKARKDFVKPNYPNVFGDIRILQNALYLNANILSWDKAFKLMTGYVGLKHVNVFETL